MIVYIVAFFIKPFAGSDAQNATLYLGQHGADPQPAYTLRRPDPSKTESKNRYAVALFDSYNPDVLFGEVLIRPRWSQASASATAAAETRRNGNAPSAAVAEPMLPSEFTIHLYEPDQQVLVRQKQGSWVGSASWEFELPQNTFRQPSASDLDRSQLDPATAETTPRYQFRWKKEGKLSKDLACLLSGRSSDPTVAKKRKGGSADPDIAVALFKQLREITMYEPNLSRIEVEDPKGLEVVVLLGAAVIRDVYFGNMREAFNISTAAGAECEAEATGRRGSVGKANGAPPLLSPSPSPSSSSLPRPHPASSPSSRLPAAKRPNAATAARPSQGPHAPHPLGAHPPSAQQSSSIPHGPRTTALAPAERQRQAEEESRRLKAQLEAEQRAKDKAEQAEIRRIKKMLEAEERDARRRQAEVDRETERLKKLYGEEQKKAAKQVQRQYLSPSPTSNAASTSARASSPRPQARRGPSPAPHAGGAIRSSAAQASSHRLSPPATGSIGATPGLPAGGGGGGHTADGHRTPTPKRSMFGLRSRSSESSGVKLNKKRSSVF